MSSMLCASVWTWFQNFVTSWSGVTFYLILSMLVICALYAVMGFVKKTYNTEKKVKWGQLILGILLFALVALLAAAKWA